MAYACMPLVRTARTIAKSAAAHGSEMLPACSRSAAATAEVRRRYACVHIGICARYSLHRALPVPAYPGCSLRCCDVRKCGRSHSVEAHTAPGGRAYCHACAQLPWGWVGQAQLRVLQSLTRAACTVLVLCCCQRNKVRTQSARGGGA